MTRKYFRYVLKPQDPPIVHDIIRREVAKAIRPVALAHKRERDRIVSNFSSRTKPVFVSEIKLTTKQIRIITTIQNRNKKIRSGSDWTVEDLWRALDKTGTRPHDIKPKKPGGVLAFFGGSYQPKTKPVGQFGGPGVVINGVRVITKHVRHPGFKPRKFTEVINAKLKKAFEVEVDRGYRLGFSRAAKLQTKGSG